MNSLVDLRPDDLALITGILRDNLPADVKVWVFGSRATWETKDSSDLDLALQAEGKLSLKVLCALATAFEDSSLNFKVDVIDLNSVSDSFRQIVESERVPLPIHEYPPANPCQTGWRELTLGEGATLTRDTVQPGDLSDELYIGLEHIGQGTLSLLDRGSASDVTSTKARFRQGDILFGKLRPYFRKLVRAPDDGICSTDIWVIRANEGIDQDYLYYVMASHDFVDFATAGSEGTRMPRAKWEHASSYTFDLPPMEEQRAIAHVLGTLDDKIELNRRMNETLESMARALFKSWFVDFEPVRAKMDGRWRRGESLPGLPAEHYDLFADRLVPSPLGEIPDGWKVEPLGDILELAYGRALTASDRRSGSIPVYGSNGQVGWHNSALVEGPGIIVGRKGHPGSVTWSSRNFFPIDTTFFVVPRDSNRGLPFLYFALRGQRLPSLSADSAVPGLNRNHAYMNRQILPDRSIELQFNGVVDLLFSRCAILALQSRTLTAQRDTLLPRLISGRVRVQGLERASSARIAAEA